MMILNSDASCNPMTPSLKKTLFMVITAYILSLIIAAYAQKITHQPTHQTATISPSWPTHGTITRNNNEQITNETISNIYIEKNIQSYAGRVMRSEIHQSPPLCQDKHCPTVNTNNSMANITSPNTPLIMHKANDHRMEKTEFALLTPKINKQPPAKSSIKKSHSALSIKKTQTPIATTPLIPRFRQVNSSMPETLSRANHTKQPVKTHQSIPLISEQELAQLLLDFQIAYRRGNLVLLFDLFGQNIHSNASSDRSNIKKSYKKLFDITQTRRMILDKVHWQKHSTNALGKGTFKLILQEKGRSASQSLSGDITIDVEKKLSNLMITQIQYNYN